MKLEWRRLFGYEDLYEITPCGKVRNVVSKRELTPTISGKDQLYVQIWVNGKNKTLLLSRLILLTFVGPPPVSNWTASHLNGDSKDSRLENLVWESFKSNLARKDEHDTMIHGEESNLAKLTMEQVEAIRSMVGTQGTIAKMFGVSQSQVSRIKSGKRWERSHRESV